MKVVIETFITIFFITLTVFIATQVIASGLQVSQAKEFHINAARAIEDSGMSEEVCREYQSKAENLGYQFSLVNIGEDLIRCRSCNSGFDMALDISECENCGSENLYIDSGNRRGLVSLDYEVTVSLLGISKEGRLETYVR